MKIEELDENRGIPFGHAPEIIAVLKAAKRVAQADSGETLYSRIEETRKALRALEEK